MIGVFDSGLGGLSVLAAISRVLPAADLVYLADSAHLPYGSKPNEFIRDRVLAIGRHLAERGCGLLVVACNTATAAAVQALRDQHPDIPVVGIEPGIKPAAVSSKTRHIAVLTTESTAQSARLTQLIDKHARGLSVHVVACPGWATRIESLDLEDPAFASEVKAKVVPLLEQQVDRLVLGCTHYSFLLSLLEPLTTGRAELIDVAEAVARQVLRLAGPQGQGSGRLTMLATSRPERLHKAPQALGLSNLASRLNGTTHQVQI